MSFDVTAQREAEEKISYAANHNPLTKLPNRGYFNARLENTLSQIRGSESGAALVIIDIDNFSDINDSLGHRIGDEVLCEAAARLNSGVREGRACGRLC